MFEACFRAKNKRGQNPKQSLRPSKLLFLASGSSRTLQYSNSQILVISFMFDSRDFDFFLDTRGFANGILKYLLTLNIAPQKYSKNTITKGHQFWLVFNSSLLQMILKVYSGDDFKHVCVLGSERRIKPVKALTTESDNLSSIPRPRLVEGEN